MISAKLREGICRLGKSLFDRGYTHGASGNISVTLDDGGMIVTPTNVSLGSLDPAALSVLDAAGHLIEGPPPTKEVPLHAAVYQTRRSAGAIVHLHSTHSVAVSMLPDIDPAEVFPPLTAYYLMRVGRTALLPYFRPGDPKVAEALASLGGEYGAVLLANHGPVVADRSLESAGQAIEELEQTARLFLLLRAEKPRLLTPSEASALRNDPAGSVKPNAQGALAS
ncbi:ribulose-5-phosphate 4-epimerase/fuculose-1-phosphate aldolase [Sphingomonas jinjuensis]|uniref:3-oxo-tetronate 4-phosphate decarboxylase n=1 Tax=Sphingomonas jinjuensis TaxID=535907 RepID=A0A840FP54_9SPHN|nr:3-oxo-tetronate 4-phosphate decarboxylase [Sphingomonas jinjuensis]MBB4155668.1 ribulose-5-phosphate 4-epimerase/fuculose-1-phosphate aldolase [Sphingomonas jinjuensis]